MPGPGPPGMAEARALKEKQKQKRAELLQSIQKGGESVAPGEP